jgi:hypothetical protein
VLLEQRSKYIVLALNVLAAVERLEPPAKLLVVAHLPRLVVVVHIAARAKIAMCK